MLSLGIDIGSSSVKVSIYDNENGIVIGSGSYPAEEMTISAPQAGWAEQEPDWWWDAFIEAYKKAIIEAKVSGISVRTIGIAYQMHGLVCLDNDGNVLRPSIIWCDSRAVGIGNEARERLGDDYVFNNLLNSPGNFTASKLKWVKENQPEIFEKIDKICLPGDYIAYRLTGELTTTISGLSEGIFYDFVRKELSSELLDLYGIQADMIPTVKESFAIHGKIKNSIASELGLSSDAVVSYKAGDQPNNAFSLNVLQAGEVAATAGTSGVIYGVSDQLFIDKSQRVNSFAHVNYTVDDPRIGILLCINGTGIANAWAKKWTGVGTYGEMNEMAHDIKPGSDGLMFMPFGNGAERMLVNQNPGASMIGLDFNIHSPAHLFRAVQEGIVCSFVFGMEAFKENNIELQVIRAGFANMFLSPLFGSLFSTMLNVPIELFNTDGSVGAARGSLVGAGIQSSDNVFGSLQRLQSYEPRSDWRDDYAGIYSNWKKNLNTFLNK